ncbi:hypothetical protein E8E14_012112 [Neopestalotiopsis sp. 37M]|nr:hypothetical protein E8E14_012112 [Neopestalotiopsis sp. 37M]
MGQDHQSLFSYELTRPYPYKWFTPVVTIGAVLFAALFSFLNLGSSGYNLVLKTSHDPNTTIAEGQQSARWPSFLNAAVQPSCQPTDIDVNSQFFTNNSALLYTLTAVWQESEGVITFLPSLTYQNNILEDCSISAIEHDVEQLDRSPVQIAYNMENVAVTTFATCSITSNIGLVFFNMTQVYNYVPSTISLSGQGTFLATNFLTRDQDSRTALWWGESLLSAYWVQMSYLLQQARKNKTDDDQFGIRKGLMYFTPSDGSTKRINDLDFFDLDYRFYTETNEGRTFSVIFPNSQTEMTSVANLDRLETYPNVWIAADSLAKSAYSTIMADLGQTSSQPSIFADTTTLEYFSQNISFVTQNYINTYPGPADKPFDSAKDANITLTFPPSVISATYFCQVPQLKSATNLIVAILVADLVLLRAIWQIYKLGTQAYLVRTRPGSEFCQGCLALSGNEIVNGRQEHAVSTEEYPLISRKPVAVQDSRPLHDREA